MYPGQGDDDGAKVLLGDQQGRLHFLAPQAVADPAAGLGLLPHLTTQLHAAWVEHLEYVRDQSALFSSSADGSLQLSDLARGTCTARHRVQNPSGKPIKSFAWCQQQGIVATCGVERHIDWWSPAISRPVVTLYGHAAAVTQVLMDEANHQLLSRSEDNCVRVWDVCDA